MGLSQTKQSSTLLPSEMEWSWTARSKTPKCDFVESVIKGIFIVGGVALGFMYCQLFCLLLLHLGLV